MTVTSTLVTDDWRFIDIGDFSDTTEYLIKKGLSGTATFTPVGLTGVSVDDMPEDWSVVARPRTARYTLGRLVGSDGVKGIRLVSSVDSAPVVWRVERDLRWNGQAVPDLPAVEVIFSGEANHLPEMITVSGDSSTSVTDAVVAVTAFIAQAEAARDRAVESAQEAADSAAAAAGSAASAGEKAKEASDDADRAEAGADRVGTAEAVLDAASRAEAAVTATDGNAADAAAAAVRAETAATDAEGVATAAATTAATAAVAHVVGTAPENLDTLGEIADKIADQDDVAAALTTQIAGKADLAHTHTSAQITDATATVTANKLVRANSTGHIGVPTPTLAADPTPKSYVDSAVSAVRATADAALPADRAQVVTTMPTTPVAGTVYYVTGA